MTFYNVNYLRIPQALWDSLKGERFVDIKCDSRRAKYQHQHASLFERPDIGNDVGDLLAGETHVRHYGMRIHEEGRERFRGRYFVRDRGKTRRIRIGSRLIGRDQMAGGAPALGDDLALRGIRGKSPGR